jgi:multiple RNA-binding domain-containing protein 1
MAQNETVVETKKRRRDEDGEKSDALQELTGSSRKNKIFSQNPDLEKAQNTVKKSKKRKTELREDKESKIRVPVVETPSVVEVVYDDSAPHDVEDEAEKPKETPATDLDWLRARTSRLLGLVSDSETSDNQDDPPSDDDVSVPSDDEPDPPETSHPPLIDPSDTDQHSKSATAESKILKTGRLFIRNLVYGITEDDLRSLFAPYGQIEEVSFPPVYTRANVQVLDDQFRL